ncbi:hypothetical protein ALC57_05683, partial [Trachymyrmex cornetzi]
GSVITTYGYITLQPDFGLRRDFPWRFIIAVVTQPIVGSDFLAKYHLLSDVNMVFDASSIFSASNLEILVLPMGTYYAIRNQLMFLKYVKYITTYRKCTFKTQTVIQMDKVTKIMVNNRYFPSKGIANDVGGIISAKSKKNTVNERRMEEHNDTCTKMRSNNKYIFDG